MKKGQTYMCFEPKRGLDRKHKINASVFEASLLICSKVPEDPCIFIGAPLMIQQVQKYLSSDTTLSLTHQIQISLIHQKIPSPAAASDRMSGVKRLGVWKTGDLTSLYLYHQQSNKRIKVGKYQTC